MSVTIPRKVTEELKRRNVNAEFLIDFLVNLLNLDPQVAAECHLELAMRYLEEGKKFVDRDPVQSIEKLYYILPRGHV